jgi:hypothetical protein
MTTTLDGTGNLGPGVLKFGETGTEVDVSCLVNNGKIEPNITAGDTKTMLCGKQKSAPDELEWTISGNVDVDAGKAAGFFAMTWQNIGAEVPFEFTPSTEVGTTVIGTCKLAPLSLGADAEGDYLNSDFEFALIDFDPATAVTYGDEGVVVVEDVDVEDAA